MLISQFGDHTTTGRALDEALHDEERLIDLLYRAAVLADGGGNGGDAYGTAAELVDDGQQDAVVYLVESVLVDVQGCQRYLGDAGIDAARALHLGKVAHSAQQGIGDTGRTSGASGYLQRGIGGNRYAQDAGRALDDFLQCLRVVILQVHVDAETGAQRCCEQSATGGGSNECEGVEVYLYRACRRTLVDHDVDAVVLHGRRDTLRPRETGGESRR